MSNFSITKLSKLIQSARLKPEVNQIELHPYLPQHEMLKFCKDEGIHVTAHSPLGGRPVRQVALCSDVPSPMSDSTIRAIAKKHGRLPADILLRWGIQRGTSVVPKSFTPQHMRSNFEMLSQTDLPAEDMQAIDNIITRRPSIRFMDPSRYWGFDIFNEDREEPIRST